MNATRSSTWVEWFCSTPQGKYFVQIDQNFIRDNFNFTGLRSYFSSSKNAYSNALEMIRGECIPENKRDGNLAEIEKDAKKLYGLVHARYLTTTTALKEIKKKYESTEYFESCPRVSCNKTRCLPYGVTEEPDRQKLRMYCPCCREVYIAEDELCSTIDGAYFGHSYLLLFLQIYPGFVKKPMKTELRLFGFKIELEDEEESESGSEY